MREMAEVENEQPPPPMPPKPIPVVPLNLTDRSGSKTATKHRPIDVVTMDPQPEASPDGPEAAFSSANRVSIIPFK